MSYQPLCMFVSKCRIQLISEVGGDCYHFISETLRMSVFHDELIPARDDALLDGALRQPRGACYTLGFAIPFPLSSRYDFVRLRIVKIKVEYEEYVIVREYTLRERKS